MGNVVFQEKKGKDRTRRGSLELCADQGRKTRRYSIAVSFSLRRACGSTDGARFRVGASRAPRFAHPERAQANPMSEFKNGIPTMVIPVATSVSENDYDDEQDSEMKAKAENQSIRLRAEIEWGSGELKPSLGVTLKMLLWKRYLYTKRDPKSFVFQNIVPVVSVLIMCIVLLNGTVEAKISKEQLGCDEMARPFSRTPYIPFWAPPFTVPESCNCSPTTNFAKIMEQAAASSGSVAGCAASTTLPFEPLRLPADYPVTRKSRESGDDGDSFRNYIFYYPSNGLSAEKCLSAGWSANQTTPHVKPLHPKNWRPLNDRAVLVPPSEGSTNHVCGTKECGALFLWWTEESSEQPHNYFCGNQSKPTCPPFYDLYLMYNYSSVFSIPVYLSLLGSGRLRQLNPDLDATYFDLTVSYFVELDDETFATDPQVYLILMMALVMAFAMISTFQSTTCVEERENHSKEQQFIGGIRPYAYWLSNYSWDMLVYMVPLLGTVVVVAAFNVKVYTNNMAAFFVFILLHGFAVAPFSYVMSFLFVTRGTAQNVVMIISGFVPLIFVLVYKMFIESATGDDGLSQLADPLKYLSFFIPGNVLGLGLYDLMENENMANPECVGDEGAVNVEGCKVDDAFNTLVLGESMLAFAAEALIYSLLVLALEYKKSEDYTEYVKTRVKAGDVDPPMCTPKNKASVYLRDHVIEHRLFQAFIFVCIALNMATILAEFNDEVLDSTMGDMSTADFLEKAAPQRRAESRRGPHPALPAPPLRTPR